MLQVMAMTVISCMPILCRTGASSVLPNGIIRLDNCYLKSNVKWKYTALIFPAPGRTEITAV